MVVVTHMIGVEDSLIDNMYHNFGHNPPQNVEVQVTNIAEKLIQEFWLLQNVQPLECHQVHTVGFFKTENHHANRTAYSQYAGFATSSKKHDPG